MSEAAGELCQRQSGQRGTECGAERLPGRVCVGECTALHRLRRRSHSETFPVRHLHERVEELAGRIDRVEDLYLGPPPLTGTLLKPTDRIGVPVVKVLE